MPRIDITVACPVHDSFRVRQVGGMFDVPIADKATERFTLDVPELGTTWSRGLIVGPSGSGKTTLARRLFGERFGQATDWAPDKAVIDGMGDCPIKEITGIFTAVGFGSPPSWIKPYHVLSGGERFRCDLARALLGSHAEAETDDGLAPTVVFDEYTSVVDRNVAKVASAAIVRAMQRDLIRCRFVAVTCHYDVTEWLEPDWVIDMASCRFERRRLRRPAIDLDVFLARRGAWERFRRHHYLSGALNPACRCFVAAWQDEPVAFCAAVPMIGQRRHYRISRVVTLPDFQGIGIGTRLMAVVADWHHRRGHRVGVTASHPGIIAHGRRSPLWRMTNVKRHGSASKTALHAGYRTSAGRAVVSFVYTP